MPTSHSIFSLSQLPVQRIGQDATDGQKNAPSESTQTAWGATGDVTALQHTRTGLSCFASDYGDLRANACREDAHFPVNVASVSELQNVPGTCNAKNGQEAQPASNAGPAGRPGSPDVRSDAPLGRWGSAGSAGRDHDGTLRADAADADQEPSPPPPPLTRAFWDAFGGVV